MLRPIIALLLLTCIGLILPGAARAASSVRILETGLLPDLQTLTPSDMHLQVLSDRVRLRFSNTIWNSGPGDLEMRASLIQPLGQVTVYQVIDGLSGEASFERAGQFQFHPAHDHWHWDGFSVYEIWSIDEAGNPLSRMLTSGKIGYCLIDDEPYAGPIELKNGPVSEFRQFGGCNWARQGLSSGWTDTYESHLADQHIDVSDLPAGIYVLRSIVDPEEIIREISDLNNEARLYFRLRGTHLEVFGPDMPDLTPRFLAD
jgi:hypothetical protein